MLVVRDLVKLYGTHHVQALKGISFDIAKGEFVAIMGPSGCGKSTLLNILAGIDRPDSGTVTLAQQDLSSLHDEQLTLLRRTRIGFVFQFFNLLSTLTALENVKLPLELNQSSDSKNIDKRARLLLEELGVSHRSDFFPAELCGGEMQRVAIARAIVHEPMVVLADEPTGNLDTENGAAVLELLKAMCKQRGLTLIMATHSPDAAAASDRIIHMLDGKIVREQRGDTTAP